MNLDDFIEHLLALRREYPAAVSAPVIGFDLDVPEYSGGKVRFGRFDPDTSVLIEMTPDPARQRRLKRAVH